MCMESRKIALMNPFTGHNEDVDVGDRLVDTVEEEDSGTNWENGMESYVSLCVK